ncbi:hypothetical protein AK812_SmicGene37279 [Symbiodinium microadriaticum]|uniref:Uncharacterized protein n=1 Tax=Symbiodinium microadriaticum TaxID=2951 RepID=A0A1Q9CGN3_SYMMI|nr:hypothetical protein AK812_SmicGene37279 [Symbiodinium microadriaticum]
MPRNKICKRATDQSALLSKPAAAMGGAMLRPCSGRGVIGIGLLAFQAFGTIRMPEEFNVEKDFEVKNKYQKAQKYIRCELCRLTVAHTLESVGLSFTEDDVYDHIEKICDAEALFAQHELLEVDAGWRMVPVSASTNRTDHAARWQSHAMKELCDNIIRPYDDEIKDVFLKHLKSKKSKADETSQRGEVIDGI